MYFFVRTYCVAFSYSTTLSATLLNSVLAVINACLVIIVNRKSNLFTDWINYKTVYDPMPNTWIWEWFEMYRINRLRAFIRNSIRLCKKALEANVSSIAWVSIKWGIHQDSLFPLLFCTGLNPLSQMIAEGPEKWAEWSEQDPSHQHLFPTVIRYPSLIISWPKEEIPQILRPGTWSCIVSGKREAETLLVSEPLSKIKQQRSRNTSWRWPGMITC